MHAALSITRMLYKLPSTLTLNLLRSHGLFRQAWLLQSIPVLKQKDDVKVKHRL